MKDIFFTLLNMSITASGLIVAILILRVLLKKAPKSMVCMMWLLVGLRLALPFSFESIFSLIPDTKVITASMNDTAVHVNTGLDAVDKPMNEYFADKYFEGYNFKAANKVSIIETIIKAVSMIWLLGTVILMAYAAVSYISLHNKLKTAVILKDNIKQSEYVKSPFLFGIIKPFIYVPYRIDDAELNYIVAHEKAHIKRSDHIAKVIGYIFLSIYWFNPLVWVAYIMFCKDIELACDERVVKELDEASRKEYLSALLNCAVRGHYRVAACPVAFSEVSVKERVKNIMKYKKPRFYIVMAAVLAVVLLTVCFLTDPKSDYEDTFEARYISMKPEDAAHSDDILSMAGISFDTKEKTFTLAYDPLSSYMSFGNYVVEDDILIATTRDGMYTYRFEVLKDKKLKFIKEGSSSVKLIDERCGYQIEDGTVFVVTNATDEIDVDN